MTQDRLPIIPTAANAVAFVFERWRLILGVALVSTAVQIALALLPGSSFATLFVALIVLLATYAVLMRAALSGPGNMWKPLTQDTLQLGLAMSAITFMYFVLGMAFVIAAMVALAAPYMDQLQAAGEDAAKVQEILQGAAREHPVTTLVCLSIFSLGSLYLTARAFVAAPATLDAHRARVFDTWEWTKSNVWRIAAAILLALGPGTILMLCLHAMISAGMGLGLSNPYDVAAAQALAEAHPERFLALNALSQIVQVFLVQALQAGLSAEVYRRIRPA